MFNVASIPQPLSLTRGLAGFGGVFALALVFAACSGNSNGDGPAGTGSTCAVGQVSCGGVCVNTQSDGNNCSACGNICQAGTVCSLGSCQVSCNPTLGLCVNACVDTSSDPSHCGDCETACGAGQTCTSAVCVGGTATGSGGSGSGGSAGSGSGGNASGAGGTNTGGNATSTGGNSSGSGGSTEAATDPNAAAHVSECIDSLPWGQSNITDRNALINVIIKTCQEFAPPGTEWQTYCQMFLVAAINKESSFNASSVVEDSYGGAADPTVGLTQIRFSSTVKDYASQGPLDALDRIGCNFPDTVSGDTAQPYLDMMKDPACNIALGAWYYFVYATGNGGSQVVYLAQYCQGQGVASNLTIGMLSHLRGPSGAVGGGTDVYVDQIKEWFDDPACNGPSTGTHPFNLTLQPEPNKYCR